MTDAPTPQGPGGGGVGGQYPPPASPSWPGNTPPEQPYGTPPQQPYGAGGPFGPPQAYSAPYSSSAQKAGFWIRFAALLIDGIVTSLFALPGILVLLNGSKETYRCDTDLSENSFGTSLCERPTSGTLTTAFILFGIAAIAGIIYYSVLEGRGATVGKSLVGIRVVDMHTGQPIGTGRGAGRYFARILSGLVCYLGYLWMLWDPDKQTWHDKIVSSDVVRT